MKKLMIAAVAGLSLALTASAETIESDVVGFGETPMIKGCKMMGAQFLNMTGENIALKDMIPVGNDVDGDGAINIQLLSPSGKMTRIYRWFQGEDEGVPYAGWLDMTPDEEGEDFVDDTITFGVAQGLWIEGTVDTGTALRTSGGLAPSTVCFLLRNGCPAIANPFATSLKLKDVEILGKNADGDGAINIQLLSPSGKMTRIYRWFQGEDEGVPYAGWLDMTPDEEGEDFVDDTIIFNAGEGLWVEGTNDSEQFFYMAPKGGNL